MVPRNLPNQIAPDQKGAYTLAAVMFILLILGLSSVFATQMSVSEQRIAYNGLHIYQARQNAQSIYSNIQTNLRWKDISHIEMGEEATFNYPKIPGTTGASQGSATAIIRRDSPNTFQLEIESRSTSNFARYALSQDFTFQQLFHFLPQQAIIARENIRLSGLNDISTLENKPGSPLVWAGGAITADLNSAEIRENDNRLRVLSSRELIQNFSRLDIDALKFTTKSINCESTQCGNDNIGENSIAYISGDITIDQNIGSASSPVILIINGQLNIQNNATIQGVVILLNDWSASTQAGNVRGSIIVDGNVDIDGVVGFQYDQEVLTNLNQNTSYFLPIAGAWRDF